MGAVPGPACYGAGGTEPTNTDTQIVLGRIDPNYYLGGEMEVDAKLSRLALEAKIGHHLRVGRGNIGGKHVHGGNDELDDGDAVADGEPRLGPSRLRHCTLWGRRRDVCLRPRPGNRCLDRCRATSCRVTPPLSEQFASI